jgi:hypothetical protein
MKYVKKPLIVEAFQFGHDEMPSWFRDVVSQGRVTLEGIPEHRGSWCRIKTLEGEMVGFNGEWIIQGIKGEIYPCKADIFEATYEPLVEG